MRLEAALCAMMFLGPLHCHNEPAPTAAPHAGLRIVRRNDAGRLQFVRDGATAGEGDVIQVGYRSVPPDSYAAIFSLDGRGVVTVHLPEEGFGGDAAPVAGTDWLEYAFRLDDAPHFERFYFVVDRAPFDVSALCPSIADGSIRRDPRLVTELEIKKAPATPNEAR